MSIGMAISEFACATERAFSANAYRGAVSRGAFRVLKGRNPILVSAPHSVVHPRFGKWKQAERYTGSLALLLHRLTDCHAIFASKTGPEDPNYDPNCNYKLALAEIIRNHQIELVLDLHGAMDNYGFDVDIGTMRRVSLLDRPDLVETLIRQFNIRDIARVLVDGYFAALSGETITRFVSASVGVPALQIEIARRWRDPVSRPECFERMVLSLAAAINEIGREIDGAKTRFQG